MPDKAPVKSNYVPNSRKSKETQPEKTTKKIITGDVVKRKKPLGQRIAAAFTGDDARSVGGYVLFDVLLPAAKAMISDAVSQGVERMLFGEARSSSSRNYTSYNRMYRSGYSTGTSSNSSGSRDDVARRISRQSRATHDFDDIVLSARNEAEEVLDQLVGLVEQYDVATVADLYSFVGIEASFADEKWGWSDLRGSGVTRVRDGYLLNLPRPVVID